MTTRYSTREEGRTSLVGVGLAAAALVAVAVTLTLAVRTLDAAERRAVADSIPSTSTTVAVTPVTVETTTTTTEPTTTTAPTTTVPPTTAPPEPEPASLQRITRQIDGMRHAPLGDLYRPKYFNGGIALHGSTSIPGHPASHGCTRLHNDAVDHLWAADLAPVGTPVWVY